MFDCNKKTPLYWKNMIEMKMIKKNEIKQMNWKIYVIKQMK